MYMTISSLKPQTKKALWYNQVMDDTTLNENERTSEMAYDKLRDQAKEDGAIKQNLAKLLGVNVEDLSENLIRAKAASLLGISIEDLAISDVANEVGVLFYETRDGESVRGGKALIIGNDGGLLAVGSARPPQDYVQAYKDGQRTSEDQFNSPSQFIIRELFPASFNSSYLGHPNTGRERTPSKARSGVCYTRHMSDEKPTKEEIKALQADVEVYMEKPVRENERRVRIGGTFEDNVKKMATSPPISNEELKKWAKKQREDIEE